MHAMTKKTIMSLAIASAFNLAAQHAYAAPADAADAAPKVVGTDVDKDGIPEVKVTATRYSTSLLKTPLAVTAFTQDKLTRQGITTLKGISGELPNVQMTEANDSAVQITIRGISATNFTEIGDPSAGLHVAGLYSPRPQGAQALMFDLEQVEVLRGPQGTLFGRNSTAGSINIIPAKPEFGSTYGSSSYEMGSLHMKQLNMIQNIAVNDWLALRATFMKVKKDSRLNQLQDFTGYTDKGFAAVFPPGTPLVDQRYNTKVDAAHAYNNQDEWAGRLAARMKFGRDVEWLLTGEKFQNNGAGYVNVRDCDQGAGTRYACTRGQWDVLINVPGQTDMTINTVRSQATWNVNANTTLDYGFAWADQQRSQVHDDDNGFHPLPFQVEVSLPLQSGGNWGTWPVKDNATRTHDSRYKSTVNELQLKQNFGALKYVAGLFWMHEKNQINFSQETLVYGPYGAPISQYYAQPDREIDAKAAFAQADWTFAPTWTGTVGGRFSRDSKSDKGGLNYGGDSWGGNYPNAYYLGLYNPGQPGSPGWRPHNGNDLTTAMGPNNGPQALLGFGAPTPNDHADSWRKFTWRLGLNKQINAQEMAYGSVSTGYKSGGFGDKHDLCGGMQCVNGPSPNISYTPYGPETVINFELGYKAKLLENRLGLSVVAFFQRYKDMQITGDNFFAQVIPKSPCTSDPACDIQHGWQTVNVAKVNIPGLEIEWDYKPWAGAKIGGFASYIKPTIHDYDSYNDGYLCNERVEFNSVSKCPEVYSGPEARLRGRRARNLEGNTLPNAPKYTFGLNMSQDFPLDSGYKLTAWGGMRYQSKIYFDLLNFDDPHIGLSQKGYAKGDVSLKLASPDDKWYVEGYVRNVTDTWAKTWGGAATGGQMQAGYIEPRTVGGRLGINY